MTKRCEEVCMTVIVTKSAIVEGLRKKKIGGCEFEEKLMMSMIREKIAIVRDE